MSANGAVFEMSQRTIQELESVIAQGQRTFIEVGNALAEIQERRLYRQYGYDTFDDYCKDRWGWTRDMGYKYISAANVARNVESILQTPPSLTQAIQMASLPAEQQQEIAERVDFSKTTVRELRTIVQETQQRPVHISYNSGENEWYTPVEYIDAARHVLGCIDLDPASSELANQTVGATRFFSVKDDGLSQFWGGRVWMNPPYAADLVGKFIGKLLEHIVNGDVPEAIVLVNNATETNWFQSILAKASAVCFPKQRIRFVRPTGNPGSPLQGQAVLYLGKQVETFARTFSVFGVVVNGRSATGRY